MDNMRVANASNGLAFPHDDVCMFQSQHGHHASVGYFRIDSMPHRPSIHLAKGGQITVIDGRGKPGISDGLNYGLPTWCLVFNRAARFDYTKVCDWETPEMRKVATYQHGKYVKALRKLFTIYPPKQPAIIGKNVHIECHRVVFDDKPDMIREYSNN